MAYTCHVNAAPPKPSKESASASSLGQLQRKTLSTHKTQNEADVQAATIPGSCVEKIGDEFHVKAAQESSKSGFKLAVSFREVDGADTPSEATREIPVILITEGMGNSVDKHLYKGELLERRAGMFDGVKAYANHPSKTEETDRPERSVKEIVGYYHSPKVVVIEGKKKLQAILKVLDGPTYQWAWDLAKESAAFAKKFKYKDLIGLSINAYGSSHQEEVNGVMINVVDDFTEVGSVDLVTQAGAGGGFRLLESIKKILIIENNSTGGLMKELLAKHGEALAQLHGAIKGNAEHEKAYGPAMEALIANHAEMVKSHAAPAPAPEAAPKDEPAPAADDKAAEKSVEEAFKAEEIRYNGGKMSEGEKKIFEMALRARTETAIKENARMIAEKIKESGIPEAYAADLATVCAGKTEAEVNKIVETRKAIVTPLMTNKANGAGAGDAKGDEKKSELASKLGEAGIKMKEVAKA